MMQPQQTQQQVIIIEQPARVVPGRGVLFEELHVKSFPRCGAVMLGITQLLLWLASFLGAALAYVYVAYNYPVSEGFWCGSFFIGSGVAILTSACRPTPRRIKHAIGSAAFTFIFAGVQFGLSLWGLIENVDYPYASSATYSCWWWYSSSTCYYNYNAMEGANGLMVGAAGLEMLILIVQIVICARALKQHRATIPAQQQLQQPTVTYIGTLPQTQQPIVNTEYPVPPAYDVVKLA